MTQLVAQEPEAQVTAFLRDLEAGDVAAAKARTAPGFAMQFPGGVTFESFEALFAWARGRYAGVRKSFDRIDTAVSGDSAIVHISGTLSGRWLDGEEFSGIRYLDRFDLNRGLIVRQTVWNDMGEAKMKRMADHGAAINPADKTSSASGTSGASGA
jgi:hypothetical protein